MVITFHGWYDHCKGFDEMWERCKLSKNPLGPESDTDYFMYTHG